MARPMIACCAPCPIGLMCRCAKFHSSRAKLRGARLWKLMEVARIHRNFLRNKFVIPFGIYLTVFSSQDIVIDGTGTCSSPRQEQDQCDNVADRPWNNEQNCRHVIPGKGE